MAKENRYVVTMDMYVYAENDYMARKRAHDLKNELRNKYDNQADVLDIVEQPFGTFNNRKLNDISEPSSGEKMPF
jgi:hypothetical protein